MPVATQPLTGVFNADPSHSSFLFAIRHMKVASYRASFSDVDARLTADDSGVRLEGAARAESISITKPPEFREHVVNGADFLDATNHPEIRFNSEDVRLGDDGTVTVNGELVIRGNARPISATGTYQPPVDDPYGAVRTAVELKATLDRRDWGIDWNAQLPNGGDVLGNEVELTVHLELIKEG